MRIGTHDKDIAACIMHINIPVDLARNTFDGTRAVSISNGSMWQKTNSRQPSVCSATPTHVECVHMKHGRPWPWPVCHRNGNSKSACWASMHACRRNTTPPILGHEQTPAHKHKHSNRIECVHYILYLFLPTKKLNQAYATKKNILSFYMIIWLLLECEWLVFCCGRVQFENVIMRWRDEVIIVLYSSHYYLQRLLRRCQSLNRRSVFFSVCSMFRILMDVRWMVCGHQAFWIHAVRSLGLFLFFNDRLRHSHALSPSINIACSVSVSSNSIQNAINNWPLCTMLWKEARFYDAV